MWARSWRTEVFEADVQHRQASESEIDASIEREPGYLVWVAPQDPEKLFEALALAIRFADRWDGFPLSERPDLRFLAERRLRFDQPFGLTVPAALPFSTSETASRCCCVSSDASASSSTPLSAISGLSRIRSRT